MACGIWEYGISNRQQAMVKTSSMKQTFASTINNEGKLFVSSCNVTGVVSQGKLKGGPAKEVLGEL